ncbi:MAG: DinB family protein [Sphingobacteriales bacterium]
MKNDLTDELLATKENLLQVLGSFDQGNINVVPFEGSWTAGLVARHILKSASGVLDALNGPVKHADRDPGQHLKLLSEIFLNFDIKMKSPDFVLPDDEPKDKNILTGLIGDTFDGIIKVAGSEDLDLICTTFEMPNLGFLSKREFIWFTIVHTQRHIHQLKNIQKHLNQ